MIARIRKDFIPVALKAATMGNPPAGIEGQIYRELRRTCAAPQGICVMNSAGKALSWTLSFDDDDSLVEFFNHTKNRYDENPDSGLGCERYRRFPTAKMDDVADDGVELEIPLAHASGERCPGELPFGDGSLAGRIVGRAYGDDGKPISDARTQDNYIEDTLEITRPMQDQLLTAAKNAPGRFRIPDSLAREIVSNAYLGMLDVNPLGGDRVRAELLAESISFWGEKQADGQLSIFGKSTVKAKNRDGTPGDTGRLWSHFVDLKWRGFAALDELGIKEIALVAEGQEELKWGGPGSAVSPNAAENPVAHLLGGRSLDFTTTARYGVSAKR
ncbi:MAG: hypothetical protein ACR2RV_03255 [Verrucomicrobiales bacterium]